MNMPRFNAQNSLYQSDVHYRIIMEPAGLRDRQAIMPQQRARMQFIDPCWSDCWLCDLLGMPSPSSAMRCLSSDSSPYSRRTFSANAVVSNQKVLEVLLARY